jgi:alkyl hydroperoxide reductase subunit F
MGVSLHVYELIILGAGPAGITAAIYSSRKKLDFMMLASNIGGQVAISSQIENYTGFQYITGEELTSKFQEHLEKYKFELKMQEVKLVERKNSRFQVATNAGTYLGKSVIVATGRKPRELNVPGESKFMSRGVSYCATCDAPLYADLDVVVVGGGNSGLEAVLQLVKIAKNISLIEVMPQLKADTALVERARASHKVKIWTNTKLTEIVGDKTVKAIKVQRDEKEALIPVQGIFVEIGSIPNSDIVSFVDKNRWGEIMVNCKCETNVPGLFSAGDVTDVPEKQIVVAAGEGCKAALQAFRYIYEV